MRLCLILAGLVGLVSFARAENEGLNAAAGPTSRELPSEACVLKPDTVHQVARVIDSQTFAIEDGREVRLVGALAPLPPDGVLSGNWTPSREALAFLTALIDGETVELVSAGRSSDRYGRLLANAFVRRAEGLIWVQGAMLEQGHARAYTLSGHTACLSHLMTREAVARAGGLGLWTNPAFAVRPSSAVRNLMRERSRFTLVEGRVHSVAEKGRSLYLNFGRNWRRDFTVVVPRRLLDRAGPEGEKLREARGRRVRVRGWIERRNGPAIEVVSLGQIEFLVGHQ